MNMKHLLKFNESEESHSLYSELSNDECEEFCESVETESIHRWEFDKLNKIFKKSGPTGSFFKYNILYESYSYGGILSREGVVKEGKTIYNIEIQGTCPPGADTNIRYNHMFRGVYDNFHIDKYEDGWYIVSRRSKLSRSEIKTYKCDQLDGVIKLLSDLGMVHKKYMIK